MDKKYIMREIAIYSALATLISEMEFTNKDFTADELYINLKVVELLETHEDAINSIIGDAEADKFTKELFMEQAQKVKNMLENMVAEGDL